MSTGSFSSYRGTATALSGLIRLPLMGDDGGTEIHMKTGIEKANSAFIQLYKIWNDEEISN
jgi:hypothetical protein